MATTLQVPTQRIATAIAAHCIDDCSALRFLEQYSERIMEGR